MKHCLLAICFVLFSTNTLADSLYVTAARLIDVTSRNVIEDVAVVVQGERVVAVGARSEIPRPEDSTLVELGEMTMLPGLIDLHVHLTNAHDKHGYRRLGVSVPRSTITGVKHARLTLGAGFTTVRNLGAPSYSDVALRDAIDDGDVPGPRIFAAGLAIGITGGHCGDENLLAPEFDYTGEGVADGPWKARSAVRRNIKFGVDLIKTCSTGGVLSKGTEVGAPQASLEELRAIVEEAHSRGYKVASHAHGATGIKNALTAGVDTIEHASFVDDEGLRLAKRQDATLVMDVYVTDYILTAGESAGILPESLEKERRTGQVQRDNFRRAVESGVKLGFGTDAGVYPHGDNARQLSVMVEYGMTPMQAIQAATITAAHVLGAEADVGSLEIGRFADLIAVDGNPLDDISVLEDVGFVMKGGKIVKDLRQR